MRLKSVCEQRIKDCTRKNQNPLVETALFYILLGTGLRESEIVSLDVSQYQNKGFHEVLRHTSKRVSQKIPLPQESIINIYKSQEIKCRSSSIYKLQCVR
jgi:integrase/recombinase XerD